jgi:hypothetical protein
MLVGPLGILVVGFSAILLASLWHEHLHEIDVCEVEQVFLGCTSDALNETTYRTYVITRRNGRTPCIATNRKRLRNKRNNTLLDNALHKVIETHSRVHDKPLVRNACLFAVAIIILRARRGTPYRT